MKRVYAYLEIAFWNKAISFLAESKTAQGLVRKAYPVVNQKKNWYLLLALVLLVASLIGGYFITSRLAARPDDAVNQALVDSLVAPESAITSLPNGQRSLLLVSADDLTTGRPKLEGAWLVLFIPPEPRLTLLPIYPSLPASEDAFPEAFSIVTDGETKTLNPDFLRLLRARDIWWSSYVVIDRASQAAILSTLESNFASTGSLPETGSHHETNLFQQAALLQEACWRAGLYSSSSNPPAPDLTGHVIADPQHLEALQALAGLNIPTGGLTCEFPTLTFQAQSGQ